MGPARSGALITLVLASVSGCDTPDAPTPETSRVAVEVAPLSLPGVTDAEYTLTVWSASGGQGEQVWTRALSSSRFGDGAGSVSYVGPCDASSPVNSVELTLHALYDADGEIPASTWDNPTPLTRDVPCEANADSAVVFDMTVARAAGQGFFDVAVELDEVFCAAKLDCVADDGVSDLELLHHDGARDLTAVLGFACAGGVGAPTWLYMDDPTVSCSVLGEVVIDASAVGNVDLAAAPNANPGGYLFGAAVFRGREELYDKAYWNVALGLDEVALATAGDCVLTQRATASSTPWAPEALGFPLPAGTVYPVIEWSVTLSTSAGGRVCDAHQVNVPGSDVVTAYHGYQAPLNGFSWDAGPTYLKHRLDGASLELLTAAGECVARTLTGPLVWDDAAQARYVLGGDADLGFGGPEPDAVFFELYTADTGSFDLASVGVNDDYATCEQCVTVFVDVAEGGGYGGVYFQRAGSLGIDPATPPGGAAFHLTLTNLELEEVTLDELTWASTPVDGGACASVVGLTELSTACAPDCVGKVCGPDGCGGVCGAGCAGGEVCNLAGTACDAGCTVVSATGPPVLIDQQAGSASYRVVLDDPALGDVAAEDDLVLQFYSPAAGTFALGTAPNDDFATCAQCLLANVDPGGAAPRTFFQSAGSVTLGDDPTDGSLDATLSGVELVEVTIGASYASTPVPGGACLSLTWSN